MRSSVLSVAELSQAIKTAAQNLGFDHVGLIPAAAIPQANQSLEAWLNNGYAADMAWMHRNLDKRQAPQTLMPGAQSVVCVTLNYHQPPQSVQIQSHTSYTSHTGQSSLKIAQYAQGADYHRVLKRKLKQLLEQIKDWQPGIRGRVFTDSAPLLERAMAMRAGLGWQGKNGNLITPDKGSFVFLGELLLDCPLVYDALEEGEEGHNKPLPSCGTCTRCIQACPTEAIVADGVVDANRCIAYWTIEFQGEFRGEAFNSSISSNLNGWIFGCDICQTVCPWNIKFAQPATEPAFTPSPWTQQPEAQAILNLDTTAFEAYYGHTPVSRTGLAGLKRNIQAAYAD